MSNVFQNINIVPWSTKRENDFMSYLNKKEDNILSIFKNGGLDGLEEKLILNKDNKLTRLIKEQIYKVKQNKEELRIVMMQKMKEEREKLQSEFLNRFSRVSKPRNKKIEEKFLSKSTSNPLFFDQNKPNHQRSASFLPPIICYQNLSKNDTLLNAIQKSIDSKIISENLRTKLDHNKLFISELSKDLGNKNKIENKCSVVLINGKRNVLSPLNNVKILKNLSRVSPQISKKINNLIINSFDS